jgi:hypothetical protein
MNQYYNVSNRKVSLPKDECGLLPGFETLDRLKDRRTVTGDLCERVAAAVYGGTRKQETRTFGFACHTDLVKPRFHMEVKSNNRSERFYVKNEQVLRYISITEKYKKPVYFVVARWRKTDDFRRAENVREIENALFNNLVTVIRIPIIAFLPVIFTGSEDTRVYRPAREKFDPFYSQTWVQSSNMRLLEEHPRNWLLDWGHYGYKVSERRRAVLQYRGHRSAVDVLNISANKAITARTLEQWRDELGAFYDEFTGANAGYDEEFDIPADLTFDPLQF